MISSLARYRRNCMSELSSNIFPRNLATLLSRRNSYVRGTWTFLSQRSRITVIDSSRNALPANEERGSRTNKQTNLQIARDKTLQ